MISWFHPQYWLLVSFALKQSEWAGLWLCSVSPMPFSFWAGVCVRINCACVSVRSSSNDCSSPLISLSSRFINSSRRRLKSQDWATRVMSQSEKQGEKKREERSTSLSLQPDIQPDWSSGYTKLHAVEYSKKPISTEQYICLAHNHDYPNHPTLLRLDTPLIINWSNPLFWNRI